MECTQNVYLYISRKGQKNHQYLFLREESSSFTPSERSAHQKTSPQGVSQQVYPLNGECQQVPTAKVYKRHENTRFKT